MQTARDSNRIPALIVALNTDGVSPVSLLADPDTHRLKVNNGITGTGFNRSIASRDDSRAVSLLATSNINGQVVNLYANSSNELLVKST